tara:strand:+ start:69 stop:719 length:651 start_codon:yes stop_codon:yes gene_type:complete
MEYIVIFVIIFLIIIYKTNFKKYYIDKIKKTHNPIIIIAILVFMYTITFTQSIFTITTSYIFGLKLGYLYSLTAIIISANIVFLISRYLFQNNVKKILEKYEYSKKILEIQKYIDNNEWYVLSLLTRFTPIPFGITNILWSITDITYYKYFITTLIGSIIFVFFESLIGHNIRNLHDIHKNIYFTIFTIIIIIAIFYYINHTIKKIFDKKLKGKKI